MSQRFISNVALAIAGAVVVVSSQAFSASVTGWLMFGISIGVLAAYGSIFPFHRVKLWLGWLVGVIECPALFVIGGWVALHTAARYPAKVGRLVAASANIAPDAIYPEMRVQQGQVSAAAAEFMTDTPMYQLYQRVAPRPEDFPQLLDKIGEAMAKDFDFTEEVRGLQVPTLIVAADADMAPPSHYVEVFELLDGGLRDGGWMGEGRPKGGHALAILPGLTHYNLAISPLFAAVTLAFLDEQPS